MNNTYTVLGMNCDGCAQSLTKAIQSITPNASVSVDLDAKSVTVDGMDEETVKQAVTDAGFEFGGMLN